MDVANTIARSAAMPGGGYARKRPPLQRIGAIWRSIEGSGALSLNLDNMTVDRLAVLSSISDWLSFPPTESTHIIHDGIIDRIRAHELDESKAYCSG